MINEEELAAASRDALIKYLRDCGCTTKYDGLLACVSMLLAARLTLEVSVGREEADAMVDRMQKLLDIPPGEWLQ